MSTSHDDEIVHRELDTTVQQPASQVASVVAELEQRAQDELKPAYDQINHVLQHIFDNPPVPEAQVEITFSYEGYRITVEQDGTAQFVKLD